MAQSQYTLRIDDREHYLFAHVKADRLSVEIARGYLAEVASACHAGGLNKVLVLRDIPEVFPDSGQFGIAQEAIEIIHGLKVCWVNAQSEIQPGLDFAALVAANRGAHFKIFRNEADAEVWLLDS